MTNGYPDCPVCKGTGYFFATIHGQTRERFIYCNCKANIARKEVAS